MSANKSAEAIEKNPFEFNCPDCGSRVKENQERCPKCGVEFEFEEIVEGECPKCGMMIPSDTKVCPFCKTKFMVEEDSHLQRNTHHPVKPKTPEEDAMYMEMRIKYATLLEEVVKFIPMAQNFSLDVTEYQHMIDKASRMEQQGNLSSAVYRLTCCRSAIRFGIEEAIQQDIVNLQKKIDTAKSMGGDTTEMVRSLGVLRERLAASYFQVALDEKKKGHRSADMLILKFSDARNSYDSLDKLVRKASYFNIDIKEQTEILKKAKSAGDSGDWGTMGSLCKNGRDTLMKVLPDILKAEMNTLKTQLLNASNEGKNVSVAMMLMKDANQAMKDQKYDEAAEKVVEIKNKLKKG